MIKFLILLSIFLINIILIRKYMNLVGTQRNIERITGANRHSDLVFIGGIPRSGTTLMRVLLDAHPLIRCGEESRIIPKFLKIGWQSQYDQFEVERLKQAKISPESIDEAISLSILEIIKRHGQPAERLCNKDPLMTLYIKYLVNLFPNSKLILMLRDGRATIHSIIKRKIIIEGFPAYDYREYLRRWNITIANMYNQCVNAGKQRCLTVNYEMLILHPAAEMKRILDFLGVPWHDSVMHHTDFLENGISLSKVEKSSDQVAKPLYMDALYAWVGQIPADVIKEVNILAPMLKVLGYDPFQNPPNYTQIFELP